MVIQKSVVIIGGGFSGIATFANLVRQIPSAYPFSLTLIEQSNAFGGLAYTRAGPEHLMNVHVSNQSLWYDKPMHLLDWLKANNNSTDDFYRKPSWCSIPEEAKLMPDTICSRRRYADYLVEALRDSMQVSYEKKFAFRSITGLSVVDIEPLPNKQERVWLSDGQSIIADSVILCTGHRCAKSPQITRSLGENPRFIADIWIPSALEHIRKIPRGSRILILGTALTACVVITRADICKGSKTIESNKNCDRIWMISRHGKLHTRLFKEYTEL